MLMLGMSLFVLLLLPAVAARIHVNFQPHCRLELVEYRYFVFFNVVLLGAMVSAIFFYEGGSWVTQLGWHTHPMFHGLGAYLFLFSGLSALFVLRSGYSLLFPAMCWSMLSFIAVVALLYQLSHVALLAPGWRC